jgi:serine/threonine-protein kinase
VELTALLTGDATQPFAEVFGNRLFIGYRYQSGPADTQIRLLRIDLSDGELPPPAIFHLEEDRFVGQSIILRSEPQQAEPSLICDAEGCLVTWDDDSGGAFSAFVPHDQNAALWHREFSSKGKRPAIARSPGGTTAIAYFAGDRLFLAPVTRDGVGAPSVVSRVSGFQPSPELIAGMVPGEWLIAWRDFEAGHREIFVARAQCPEGAGP